MEKYFDINEQKFSIRCKIYCKDLHNIKRVVIGGHGFGSNKDNNATARFAEHLISKYKDTAVVCFDWPCHGQDARNKLSLVDCDAYLSIVLDYVKKTYGTDKLYCYAASFGGYLVLKYISEHGNPFIKIALRCPAVCMYDILDQTILTDEDKVKLAKGRDAMIGFDRKVKVNSDYIEEVKANDITVRDFMDYADDILVIQGDKDEIVPYDRVQQFTDDNVIELITSEGTEHRFRNQQKMDQAHQDILKFFDLH